MSGEHRDQIYMLIEEERLKQERGGHVHTTFWGELRAVLKVVLAILLRDV